MHTQCTDVRSGFTADPENSCVNENGKRRRQCISWTQQVGKKKVEITNTVYHQILGAQKFCEYLRIGARLNFSSKNFTIIWNVRDSMMSCPFAFKAHTQKLVILRLVTKLQITCIMPWKSGGIQYFWQGTFTLNPTIAKCCPGSHLFVYTALPSPHQNSFSRKKSMVFKYHELWKFCSRNFWDFASLGTTCRTFPALIKCM